MDLCQYKDIFGKVGEGAHKYRIPILDIALVDTAMTLGFGIFLAWLFKWSYWITIVLVFIAGILAHKMFCVKTRMNRALLQVNHIFY
jgi:hypothetical protein